MQKVIAFLGYGKWFLAGILLVAACGEMQMPKDRPTREVAISTFDAVAGNWSGRLRRTPKQSGDNFVEVVISADGRWKFATARTVGVFSGGGNLSIQNGKLVAEDAGGRATFTLYEEGGKRMLVVSSRERGGKVRGWDANLFPAN
ncbi:MAG: hypothetical protein GTO40_31135 [Deltaproteobacteria bacterium]|nr:hypothetical protein [Deltaproteobacteria bacterium]